MGLIRHLNENTDMKTVNDIREDFLSFFESKNHSRLPSSALIPHNDPTLMFANAGMNQFKNVFSGAEHLKDKQGNPIVTATTSQKCVRAGGKHNDLDNVGYTARHHTFFEMLGNFSFGDYFKKDAIKYAWEFLTVTLALPKDKLYVTIYHTDDEAFDLWKDLTGFPDDKILRNPTSDNFWSMGDTGPCGPCSEVFYDHGDKVEGEWALGENNEDKFGDRFIEIWNLVFMQYEKHKDGSQTDLPAPCIDTGMGLERLAAILQNVHNNYDIDLFKNLIKASKEISGNDDVALTTSHRIIADHLRSCSFLIADGIMPSNEGRGYVLRRIMRRAMRHAHILGCKEPLIYKLVPALIKEMGEAYPELQRAEAVIVETLKNEEERFRETLGRGLKLLEEEASDLKQGDSLHGEIAFKLYDTYGFPLDLTQDILRGKGVEVDLNGFNAAMDEQKKKARASWSGAGGEAESEIWFEIQDKFGATEFLGYDSLKTSGKVTAILKDNQSVKSAKKGDEIFILTNQTSFYGESGGQTGDKGIISNDDVKIEISDTKKQLGSLHIHIGKVLNGSVKLDDVVELQADEARRDAIRLNHSATHILHAGLHKIIGEHVTQKGSLVEADYFRFDLNHNKALTLDEIAKLEDFVNDIVRKNAEISTKLMSPDEAIENGAMALFGEKYGDEVRVVSVAGSDEKYSVELCGGIHAERSGDIGLFKITREGAVAAGIRRIEAVTGKKALEYVSNQQKLLAQAAGALKTSAEELPTRISSLLDSAKKAEKEITELRKKIALGGGAPSTGGESSASDVEEINGVKFVGKSVSDIPAKDLRGLVDEYKKQIESGVVVIISETDGKVAVVTGVTGDLTDKFSAVDLVKIASVALGGKGGGGRPDFAQAGGADASQATAAIVAVKGEL